MIKLFLLAVFTFVLFTIPSPLYAQIRKENTDNFSEIATESAQISTPSATPTPDQAARAKEEFEKLFAARQVNTLSPTSFGGYLVQKAFQAGVPANTIILVLLVPFLATIFVFVRQILGLPTLDMWVSIALTITLITTGAAPGIFLLAIIFFASTVARFLLQWVKIMQLSKHALSLLIVSLFVFGALFASAYYGILSIRDLSIFPILLAILLSEEIFALQLSRGAQQTIFITATTGALGVIGFILASMGTVRNFLILYPEIILLLIPINILMGRYFGLRLSEMIRFKRLSYGS